MICLLCVRAGSRCVLAFALLGSLCIAANVDAGTSGPAYSLTDLGALPTGPVPGVPVSSTATGINDAGQVVGSSAIILDPNDPVRFDHAFVTHGGALQDLGTPNGALESDAVAINASGQIAGDGSAPISGSSFAALYSNGTFKSLGNPSSFTNATGINNSGQVVGNILSKGLPPQSQAFIYSNGTTQNLGTLGGIASSATGINNAGQVIGNITTASGNQAFVYSNGNVQMLGTLGGTFSSAAGINDSGQIVGNFDAGSATHAFLYSGGAMQDLGTLPGFTFSEALAINASGEIVGDLTNSGVSSNQSAFLYDDGTMYDLSSLIVDLQGDTIISASGINASGQIAATVMLPSGATHAVLLSVVPLPAAAWAGLTMLPVLLLAKRFGPVAR
jgi:probable HAF family extracellular repeat protein